MIPKLEPLEIHSGMIFGRRRNPTMFPPLLSLEAQEVWQVIEKILLPALSKSPCIVAFSGGRDSSAVLAIATDVARRHGLSDPIPLTFRFENHPRTGETEWQELMIRHLKLEDWEIVDIAGEFDVLGPPARDALRHYGLFWPPNSFTMLRMFQSAKGGALLTGTGGDEVFGSLVKSRKMTPIEMFRFLPPSRAVMTLLVNRLPLPWKIRAQTYHGLRLPWLRSAARREVRRRFVEDVVESQKDRRHPLEKLHEGRYMELGQAIRSALAEDTEAVFVEPFSDPRFLRAVIPENRDRGFLHRNAALEFFFGHLLPPAIARRTTKAVHTEVFWGPDTREFARRWDGGGLDSDLVDPDVLRSHWLRPRPDMRSTTPLQAAWLSSVKADLGL